jgi:hypothetical protein
MKRRQLIAASIGMLAWAYFRQVLAETHGVRVGYAAELLRPFESASKTHGKRLQILKEILPSLSRAAVLVSSRRQILKPHTSDVARQRR